MIRLARSSFDLSAHLDLISVPGGNVPVLADQRIWALRISPPSLTFGVTTEDPIKEGSRCVTVLAAIFGKESAQMARV
jgi:hypothetical protein